MKHNVSVCFVESVSQERCLGTDPAVVSQALGLGAVHLRVVW